MTPAPRGTKRLRTRVVAAALVVFASLIAVPALTASSTPMAPIIQQQP